MAGWLTLWWVWLCAALLLGVVELLLPGSIFLGFALGALAMALIVALFAPMNVASLLALFAVLSLLAWIGLRLVFRRQSSGARIVTRDINEN
ncbi:NfeD family protein [Sulfitobacter sp. PS-8MA]|uniref:NfeD family protein n=1 Tax=Sulfitobacter sp. PS-8MA TaxID=3237707 RepID=UPI0034C612DD